MLKPLSRCALQSGVPLVIARYRLRGVMLLFGVFTHSYGEGAHQTCLFHEFSELLLPHIVFSRASSKGRKAAFCAWGGSFVLPSGLCPEACLLLFILVSPWPRAGILMLCHDSLLFSESAQALRIRHHSCHFGQYILSLILPFSMQVIYVCRRKF